MLLSEQRRQRMFAHVRLLPGYAETSTRKYPREPETVVVGEAEAAACVCQGSHIHPDGSGGWLRFKVKGKSRYYFQHRPY